MEDRLLATYRQLLLKLREDLLLASAENEQTQTVDLDQCKVGRLSRIDALQTQQIALETRRRNQRRLQAVEGALRRLEAGEYGECFACGESISAERLAFDPTITRCRDCAEDG